MKEEETEKKLALPSVKCHVWKIRWILTYATHFQEKEEGREAGEGRRGGGREGRRKKIEEKLMLLGINTLSHNFHKN